MDSNGYLGFIELFVVFGFVIGWGVLELVGLRLDKKREIEKKRDEAAAENEAAAAPSALSKGAGHPEG